MVDSIVKNLYMVYWKQGTRKALVKGKDEEEVIKEARKFCGEYAKIFKIEKIDLDNSCHE